MTRLRRVHKIIYHLLVDMARLLCCPIPHVLYFCTGCSVAHPFRPSTSLLLCSTTSIRRFDQLVYHRLVSVARHLCMYFTLVPQPLICPLTLPSLVGQVNSHRWFFAHGLFLHFARFFPCSLRRQVEILHHCLVAVACELAFMFLASIRDLVVRIQTRTISRPLTPLRWDDVVLVLLWIRLVAVGLCWLISILVRWFSMGSSCLLRSSAAA
mmetsp:Transcript_35319/g.110374  ORF Transcript_35319/g.110374 Transcript_35319/m.110374 type:complete len:211 (+) Transcript_35319:1491-2123(+)